MLNKMIALSLFAFVVSANAQTLPTCKVTTLKDAQKCMEKVASVLPDYEEANEGMASADKVTFTKLLKSLNYTNLIPKVAKADFSGFVLEHGDEHVLYYFLMNKGSAKPVKLFTLNLADLSSTLVTSKITPKDFFLGTKFDGSDITDEILEQIEYYKADNQ